MSDGPDGIVLRYLRRIDERMDGLFADMRDVKARLPPLEEQISQLRSEAATLRGDFVRIEHRLDRVDDRLSRIEKRWTSSALNRCPPP